MSDERRPQSLVSQMRPAKTERELIIDVARAIDSFRESQERHNSALMNMIHRVSTKSEQTALMLAELTGHVMRTDAATRDGSSHDLEQDAKLAAIEGRVASVETGWQRFGRVVVEFYESKRTRTVGRVIFGAAMAYAVGKETGLLHVIAVALQGSGVLP